MLAAAALDKQIVQLPLGLYSVPVTDIFIILIPVYAIPHASLQHPAGSESVLVADIELQPIGLQIGFLGKAAEGAQIDGVIIGLPGGRLADADGEIFKPLGSRRFVPFLFEGPAEDVFIEAEVDVGIEADIGVKDQGLILTGQQ